MLAIPKRFELGPHTVTVRIVSEKEMIANIKRRGDYDPAEYTPVGYTIWDENLILIRRACKALPPEMQVHTFWHEYFHMLLERAGRPRLARDETLVDTLGALQLQALKSAKY